MKLGSSTANKKPSLSSLGRSRDDDEGESKKADMSSWAVTDSSQFAEVADEAKRQAQRAPELYIKDGQTVRLRFRSKEPFVSFMRYRMKINGKWQFFVKPPDDQDVFAEQGKRPQRVFVYEVIDLDGFVSKQGKRFRRVPRFFLATVRQYDQLRLLVKNVGLPLNQFVVRMSRAGAGTDTTYAFHGEPPSPMTDKERETPRIKGDFEKYYAPLSVKQQRKVLGGRTSDDDDDN